MASTYFITGTTYEVIYPDEMEDTIDLSDIYDKYFNDEGSLPDDVEVIESEVTHFWEGDIV